MATTQHYVWAGGHIILLISALRYILAWATFKTPSSWWYKASYVGALVSYSIVCQKSLGSPQPNAAWARRALADENVQYLILAFFWLTSKPVALSLLPYTIFSLFHALTFTRTTLMPQFLPPGPPATAGGTPTPHPLSKKLQVWVRSNYDSAMRVVAYTEIFILARVIVGAFMFRNSFLTPIIYAHFIRMRFFQSTFTRESIIAVTAKVDEYANGPDVPPVIKQGWATVQSLIGRWTGTTLNAPTNQAPPAAGAR
ncbi:hypothetical protein B0F90DRAFT_1664656 [Multifurca ochricompacta]|uniref:Endoplasmic reticulum protein n=1 Tax=Multifurca ochricompacta TaxID=376703 RepID=A0AAD4MCK6_9AGAM|nr:hypothetical protein B0F90DRAFT_1664656 [Multifurca ochricompacta]